ncbi:MAG: SH3 domain-containing protein [Anaerolineae bacterium]|nr:SH3 domain-containing protein [Anaerolineae bacterium]MDW8299082.1 SH3 domain-containing protein [Anaerolineae bacterium]
MSRYEDPYSPSEYDDSSVELTHPSESTPIKSTPPKRPLRPTQPPAEPRQVRQAQPLRHMPPPPPVYEPAEPRLPQAPARRRPVPQRPSKRESGWYLPWWTLLVLIAFVAAAAIGAWAVVDAVGGNAAPGGQTPIVIVVTATFTIGPPPTYTPLPQVQPTVAPLPTVVPTPTLPPGEFRPGVIVEVVGVGLNGLNIRAGAGTSATLLFVAPERTRFMIMSGPQNASGLEWWEVREVNAPNRTGWAARNYLQAVDQR